MTGRRNGKSHPGPHVCSAIAHCEPRFAAIEASLGELKDSMQSEGKSNRRAIKSLERAVNKMAAALGAELPDDGSRVATARA